ncbi:MAG: hypothetical protein CM15mP49_34160 [Actinomycetota bacterium]|nr:MAG: hypothetical protein CM15mP49_34160 [Actinomycetota bacterium]
MTELASPLLRTNIFVKLQRRGLQFAAGLTLANLEKWVPFLADPSQTFHTGQQVCVDGGYTIFESCVLNHSNYFIASQDSGSISLLWTSMPEAPKEEQHEMLLQSPHLEDCISGLSCLALGVGCRQLRWVSLWEISGSSGYLGAIIFANLGPLALLSLVGGSLCRHR